MGLHDNTCSPHFNPFSFITWKERGRIQSKLYHVGQSKWIIPISEGLEFNWGGSYDHLISTRIFTIKFNKIFIQAPKKFRKVGYSLNLDLLSISYYSCVLYPRRRGLGIKSHHLRPIYLWCVWFDHILLHSCLRISEGFWLCFFTCRKYWTLSGKENS